MPAASWRSCATTESRCSYLGLDTARWRIALLLVACGVVAALAGFGYGAPSGVVAPELTGFVFGTELIIWVALGGRGTIWGRCWARS